MGFLRHPNLRAEYKRDTVCYACCMKHYAWNPEKNELLKEERGVSFEEAVFHVEAGDEVDIFEHPNQEPGRSGTAGIGSG